MSKFLHNNKFSSNMKKRWTIWTPKVKWNHLWANIIPIWWRCWIGSQGPTPCKRCHTSSSCKLKALSQTGETQGQLRKFRLDLFSKGISPLKIWILLNCLLEAPKHTCVLPMLRLLHHRTKWSKDLAQLLTEERSHLFSQWVHSWLNLRPKEA